MSSSSHDGPSTPRSQMALSCFEELLECAVADVASECHRIARLGLDRGVDAEEEELRLWATRAGAGGDPGSSGGGDGGGGGGGNKGLVDVFGQTHPAVAADVLECMNCGRPIVAGRFALHLEKCMGKGRKARTKTTRSSTAGRNKNNQGSPMYTPYSNAASANRVSVPNGIDGGAAENHNDHALQES